MNWLPFGKRKQAGPDSQGTAVSGANVVAPKGKILIVDDDAVIIKTTSLKLKSNGYEISAAQDAAETMTAVRQFKPDLILLDISFPPDMGSVDWDGFKIMAWLQRMEESKNIPVIIITGGDPARYRNHSLATGAVAFFNKPIQHDELLTFIAEILRGKANASAAAAA